MTDTPADDAPAVPSGAEPVPAQVFAAHCTNCGEVFSPQAMFCGSCGVARNAAPLVGYSAPTTPLPLATASMVSPVITDAAREMPALSPPAVTPPGARLPGRDRVGHGRAAAISAALVLALVGGAVGAIFWTRQNTPSPAAIGPVAVAATKTSTPTSAPTNPSPTTNSQTFADLYQNVKSGVVRIQATTCDGGGVGTGFLIAPDLVATVAHVVNASAALNLTVGENGGGGTTSGVVVGIDPAVDVALVRLERPILGHIFTMAAATPNVGQEVAAIGFPEGDPMTFTRGSVSGLDRTIPIENVMRNGLIETDAAINPGNSGGPLLSADGQVVGLVDAKNMAAEGIGYAVAPAIANLRLQSWKGSSASAVSAPCANPAGPQQGQQLAPSLPGSPDAITQAVGAVFARYFDGINSADYTAAWSTLSPRLQGPSASSFADGTATSYDTEVMVLSVTPSADGSANAHVSFTSVQATIKGPDGDTCDNWDLDYTLIPSGGSWLIDNSVGHNGGPTHTRC